MLISNLKNLNNIMLRISFSLIFSVFFFVYFSAQDLEDLLDEQMDNEQNQNLVQATFKGTHIVLGQSIENTAKGELNFLIKHHFGTLNSGAYQLWGLDQSDIRLGFEYGITDRFQIGIGRSSYNKLFDGSIKTKILRQQEGKKNIPISLSFYSVMTINSLRWADPNRDNLFSSRMSYGFEFLIARKMTHALSLQLTPGLIHRNLVKTALDENDVYSLGAGGRYKIGKRFSINAEYYYILSEKTSNDFYNSFSVGFDIETGGHVFQIFLTNSNTLIEPEFIPNTKGSWANGDIRIGFNIARVFTIIKHKEELFNEDDEF